MATHNYFVFDRGGKVFKQSAPVIKLKPEATEEEHLRLLGVLNSSTACFWMQQAFHNKGGPGGGSSKDERWHDFYEHDSTKLARFPLPARQPAKIPAAIVQASDTLQTVSPAAVLTNWTSGDLKVQIAQARETAALERRRMIA